MFNEWNGYKKTEFQIACLRLYAKKWFSNSFLNYLSLKDHYIRLFKIWIDHNSSTTSQSANFYTN